MTSNVAMNAANLLKAYEATTSAHTHRTTEHIDRESRLILILAIYDYRSGEWVHDFLVEQKHLPLVEGEARKTQVRKVQRWRAAVEAELGLPRRPRGGATPAFRAMRQTWEAANPRPTIDELLAGWAPKPVDYSGLGLMPAGSGKKPVVVAAAPAPAKPAPAVVPEQTAPEPTADSPAEDDFQEDEYPRRRKKPGITLPKLGPEAFKQQPPPEIEIPVNIPHSLRGSSKSSQEQGNESQADQ